MKIPYLLLLFVFTGNFLYSQEICDNGIDDDGDLDIDLEDSECECLPTSFGFLSEDFENYSSCPTGFGGYLDLITEWRPAGTPQAVNTCGYLGSFPFPQVPLPIPSGEGSFGMTNDEGLVHCLDNCTLIEGQSYTISFYGAAFNVIDISSVEFVLYGRANCNNLNSGPADYDYDFMDICSSGFDWTELISISPTGNLEEWEFLTGTFTANADYGALFFSYGCQGEIVYSYIDDIEIAGDFAGSDCDLTPPLPEIMIDLAGDCISGNVLTASPDTAVQYQWYLDEIAIPGATDNPWTIDPYIPGEYQVRAIYTDGACAVSAAVTLEEANLEILDIDLITTDPLCFGENTGSIESVVDSPNTPFQFVWNTGSEDSELTNLGAGNYSVTVTDAKGCFGSSITTLAESNEILLEFFNNPPLCFGEDSGSIEAVIDDPNPLYEFVWNTGSEDSELTNLGAGNYSVTVTNANDCSESFATTLSQPAPFLLELSASQPTLSQGGIIEVFSGGGTLPYQYEWNNGFSEPLISDLEPGVYSVTAIDDNNCAAIADVELLNPLMVDNIRDNIYIPNAFSPNDDGINDKFDFFFHPKDLVISIMKIQVFNRWGGLMFEALNQEPGSIQFWNGITNGKSAEPGVYIYIIQLKLYNEEYLILSGDITLIR
ncbi:MAG: gliding motility-associated C-terminal domain-containing protein [Saprospiraceae bacterium]